MLRRGALVCLAVTLAGCSASSGTSTSPAVSTSLPARSPSPSQEPTPTGEPSDLVVDVPKPGAVIAAFGSIWVQDRADGSIWRLDPAGNVLAKIPRAIRSMRPLGWESFTLDAGFGSVWALGDGVVVRIDPATNEPVSRIEVPDYAYGLAVGEGGTWVACCAPGPPGSGVWPRLMRIDPSTDTASVFAKELTSPSSFAVGSGFVWWGNFSEAGAMQRIDPATGEQVRIESGNMRFIVPTRRWVWLIADGSLQRVSPRSNGPAVDTGRAASIAIGAVYAPDLHWVWINAGDAIAFDASTGVPRSKIDLARQAAGSSGGIAIVKNRAWVADPAGQRVIGTYIGE